MEMERPLKMKIEDERGKAEERRGRQGGGIIET